MEKAFKLLQKENTQLKAENAALKLENAELRAENKVLHGGKQTNRLVDKRGMLVKLWQ